VCGLEGIMNPHIIHTGLDTYDSRASVRNFLKERGFIQHTSYPGRYNQDNCTNWFYNYLDVFYFHEDVNEKILTEFTLRFG